MALKFVVPVALAVALAGCGSIGAISFPWKRDHATSSPDALPSATAVGPVESTDIGPPGGTTIDGTTGAVTDSTGKRQSRRSVAGAAGFADRGGRFGCRRRDRPHRSSRRLDDHVGRRFLPAVHDADELDRRLPRLDARLQRPDAEVDLRPGTSQGSQVILAGQGGAPVATLTSSGNNRFDGQANGQGVTFFR